MLAAGWLALAPALLLAEPKALRAEPDASAAPMPPLSFGRPSTGLPSLRPPGGQMVPYTGGQSVPYKWPPALPRDPLRGEAGGELFPSPSFPAGMGAGAETGLLESLIVFYQRVVSPLDGDRCQMAPTCSLYGRQALARHGPFLGLILTADRLLHEGDEMLTAPRVRRGGHVYFADPLEANSYWLPEGLK